MPYVKRRRTFRKRRPYTSRRTTRYGRKKGFAKRNTRQRATIKAPVMPRNLYTTLPWFSNSTLNVPGSGSASVAFLGNSLVPVPSSYSTVDPAAGDVWASGVTDYASFYQSYRVLASMFYAQMVMVTGLNIVRIVLIPITSQGSGGVSSKITALDAMTYDQLSSQPASQTRILGLASGGNASVRIKMFRKTTSMLGIKDIRDNEDTLLDLPDTNGSNGTIVVNGNSSFFYYLRFFNASGSSQQIEINYRMRFYCQLTDRGEFEQTAVPA